MIRFKKCGKPVWRYSFGQKMELWTDTYSTLMNLDNIMLWKKLVTKDRIPYYSIYLKFLWNMKPEDKESVLVVT